MATSRSIVVMVMTMKMIFFDLPVDNFLAQSNRSFAAT